MKNQKKRTLVQQYRVLTGLAVLTVALPALAAFPDKPITLIVPYPPGGTTDIAARTMAQAMSPILGQPVVVDNRSGAGGSVGMGVVARAKPDGYTMGMGTIGTQTINQYLYNDMPFNPEKDFEPVGMVLSTPNVIAVRTDSPITSLKDLVQRAKNSSTQLMYASPGMGSSVHLTGAYLEQVADINMMHIPFKGLAGSLPAAIGGQVDVLIDNLPSTLSLLQDGSRIRALAVTSAERSPSLPNVPTAKEAGLNAEDVTAWFALYAPKGTPDEAMTTLIEATRKALAMPEVQEKLASLGSKPGALFGKDLTTFEEQERQRWSKLIKDRKITLQ